MNAIKQGRTSLWGGTHEEPFLTLAVCFVSAAVNTLFAQGTTATISGTVTDSTGAAVANAKVTATNTGTRSDAIPPTLTAVTRCDSSLWELTTWKSPQGFKKFEQTGVILEINHNPRVDALLQVGGITETVEVTVDAASVETSQPAPGVVVTNKEIENMPLINRDLYTLLTLTPGVDNTEAATDNFGAQMQATIINRLPQLQHRIGELHARRREQYQRPAQYRQRHPQSRRGPGVQSRHQQGTES